MKKKNPFEMNSWTVLSLKLFRNAVNCNIYKFHTSTNLKKRIWNDDTKVTLINVKNKSESLTFSELRTLAIKSKLEKMTHSNLVNIKSTMDANSKIAPIFQFFNDSQLEVALRKARTKYLDTIFTEVDPETLELNRINHKSIKITAGTSEAKINKEIKKARNELLKGNFVLIQLKSGAQTENILNVENHIRNAILEGDVESKKSRLTIKPF